MVFVEQRYKKWTYSFTLDRRYRGTLPYARSRKEALAAAERIRARVLTRLPPGYTKNTPARHSCRSSLAEIAALDCNQFKAERALRWKPLLAFFGEQCEVRSITPKRVTGYVDSRRSAGTTDDTIRREIAALKRGLGAYRDTTGVELLLPPSFRWAPPPREKGASKMHPLPIIQKWLAALPTPAAVEAELALLTGLRASELQRLDVATMVEQQPGSADAMLHLSAAATKTGRPRRVGLPPRALELVQQYVPGNYYRDRIRAQKAIGYDKTITLRDLRAMHITMALEKMPLAAVRDSVGHTSIATTNLYAKGRDATKVAAAVGDIWETSRETCTNTSPPQHSPGSWPVRRHIPRSITLQSLLGK
jgi:integrase